MAHASLRALWKSSPNIEYTPEPNQKWVLEDEVAANLNKNPFHPVPDFDTLEQYYQIIYESGRPPWREIILSLTSIKHQKSTLTLRGRRLDSATNMAIRQDTKKRRQKKLFQVGVETVVNAITLSPDKTEILMGIRGGYVMSGTHALPPGGAVTYQEMGDPLTAALYQETEEELGATKSQIEAPTLFGYFSQTIKTCAPNNQFVYEIIMKHPLTDFIERHRQAFEAYQQRKKEGVSEQDARRILKESNFPKDAWEHTTLYTIPNNAEAILKLFHDLGPKNNLELGLYGSFPLYLLFRHGDEALREWLKNPATKSRTDMSSLQLY